MKRLMITAYCLAVTALFLNCSQGKDGSESQPQTRVIKASELISADEAAALLEESVIVEDDLGKVPYTDVIAYRSESYFFQVTLTQEALYDKDSGWRDYLKEMEKNIARATTPIDIGDGSAYLQESSGVWTIYVFYGDYYITLGLIRHPLSHEDTDEEILWKKETLAKSGKLAVKNLKEIIK